MAISHKVQRLLWSKSAGYCQNPHCNRDLFVFFQNGTVTNISQLAHIIAKSPRGPRGVCDKKASEKDEFENIILLCPTCHELIDKNPDQYPAELLLKWKSEHENRIKKCFVVPLFKTRKELKAELNKLLRKNREVFLTYGPEGTFKHHVLTDANKIWQKKCIDTIIPNNRKVISLLTANEHLLTEQEKDVVERFNIHREAFEYNHLSGDKLSCAPLFPTDLLDILKEE